MATKRYTLYAQKIVHGHRTFKADLFGFQK